MTQIESNSKEFMDRAGDIYFEMADFPKSQELSKRWKKFLPPNIANDGPDPQIEAAMHQAADKIQQLTELATNQAKQLADKDRQLAISEGELKLKKGDLLLKTMKTTTEEHRADYDAETKRVTALGNAGPAISLEQIGPVVKQLVQGMLTNGEIGPGMHEGGTPITPVEGAGAEKEMNGMEARG
jgi:hypothetical protein